MKQKEKLKAFELFMSGKSLRKIAIELSVAKSTVEAWAKTDNWQELRWKTELATRANVIKTKIDSGLAQDDSMIRMCRIANKALDLLEAYVDGKVPAKSVPLSPNKLARLVCSVANGKSAGQIMSDSFYDTLMNLPKDTDNDESVSLKKTTSEPAASEILESSKPTQLTRETIIPNSTAGRILWSSPVPNDLPELTVVENKNVNVKDLLRAEKKRKAGRPLSNKDLLEKENLESWL